MTQIGYPKPVKVVETKLEKAKRYEAARREIAIADQEDDNRQKHMLRALLGDKVYYTLKNKRVKPLKSNVKKNSGKLLGKIRKEVETLAKIKAKTRDNYICQRCGKKVEGSNAHASHIVPVSHGNVLRFNPRNMICLCYHCHINWWHKNPMESSEWFIKNFPETWEYLKIEKEKIVKFTLEDYEQMKYELQST